MPRGVSNAEQFQRELQQEFNEEVLDGYEGLRREMGVQIAEVAESLVPRQTGRLARSIAASIGTERKGGRGGSAQVRRVLSVKKSNAPLNALRINFQTIYIMVNDFRASLLELGTVNMSPRPFWRAAVESVRNLRR